MVFVKKLLPAIRAYSAGLVAWSEEKLRQAGTGSGTFVCRKFCCVTSRTLLPFQYSSGR